MDNEKIDFLEAAEQARQLKKARRAHPALVGMQDCECIAGQMGIETVKGMKAALVQEMGESLALDMMSDKGKDIRIAKIAKQEREAMGKTFSEITRNLSEESIGIFDGVDNALGQGKNVASELDNLGMVLNSIKHHKRQCKGTKEFSRSALPEKKQKELHDALEEFGRE